MPFPPLIAEAAATLATTIAGYSLSIHPLQNPPASVEPQRQEMTISRGEKVLETLRGGEVRLTNRTPFKLQDELLQPGRIWFKGGSPMLAVLEYSVYDDCCLNVHLYSLGAEFKKLGTIPSGFTMATRFTDGKDAVLYETRDFTLGGWGGQGMKQPAPPITLRVSSNGIKVAWDLMKQPKPSDEELKNLAASISHELSKAQAGHRGADLPLVFTDSILTLLYGGNENLILKLIDLSWPKDRPGKNFAWSDIKEALARSPFWTELKPIADRVIS